mmetsp:Transcript_68375/g.190656  ORF Transcript_68375/g.190656 Transcript_68375/m.190656 type:complete len:561 (+) Transcript_68375:44-1726(+)
MPGPVPARPRGCSAARAHVLRGGQGPAGSGGLETMGGRPGTLREGRGRRASESNARWIRRLLLEPCSGNPGNQLLEVLKTYGVALVVLVGALVVLGLVAVADLAVVVGATPVLPLALGVTGRAGGGPVPARQELRQHLLGLLVSQHLAQLGARDAPRVVHVQELEDLLQRLLRGGALRLHSCRQPLGVLDLASAVGVEGEDEVLQRLLADVLVARLESVAESLLRERAAAGQVEGLEALPEAHHLLFARVARDQVQHRLLEARQFGKCECARHHLAHVEGLVAPVDPLRPLADDLDDGGAVLLLGVAAAVPRRRRRRGGGPVGADRAAPQRAEQKHVHAHCAAVLRSLRGRRRRRRGALGGEPRSNEPMVSQRCLGVQPLRDGLHDQLFDQVACSLGRAGRLQGLLVQGPLEHGHLLGQGNGRLEARTVERVLTRQRQVEHYPDGPHVGLRAVEGAALEDLRGPVPRGAGQLLEPLFAGVALLPDHRNTEVDDLRRRPQLVVRIHDQAVVRLHVAMDHADVMAVCYRRQDVVEQQADGLRRVGPLEDLALEVGAEGPSGA